MAFIRFQGLKMDESGLVTGGTASIIDVHYVKGESYHSKQEVRELLGKVLWVRDDKKGGIFISPTRGLVAYDAKNDSFEEIDKGDERIQDQYVYVEAPNHSIFGDSYLVLEFLKKVGLMDVFKCCFSDKKDLERLIAHIVHSITRNGGNISCENEVARSFLSYIVDDIPLYSLKSDTLYFSQMGSDIVRMNFFKNYIKHMRKTYPNFGNACFVDSTPLPNSILNNPFNALCSHGLKGSEVQTRLVLILDEETGLPLWYNIIPGNLLDLSTIVNIIDDVKDSLDITVNSLVLDAGYVTKEFLLYFKDEGTDGRKYIARMPAKKGYPFKELYHKVKPLLMNGKYVFKGSTGHTYFGIKKEITLYKDEVKTYAYVYVDKINAELRFSEYLERNEEEYEKLKDADKSWKMVSGGYFILLSNVDTTPEKILSSYFERTDIETVFKSSKEYIDLLPLSKWSDLTVRGKILSDIISTIVLLMMRKSLNEGKEKKNKVGIPEILGKTSALMCSKARNNRIRVETPTKQAKLYYDALGIEVPHSFRIDEYKEELLRPLAGC